MVMGMPAWTSPSASNRVGVFLQKCHRDVLVSVQLKKLGHVDIMPVIGFLFILVVYGGFAGKLRARTETWLKPLLLSAMIGPWR